MEIGDTRESPVCQFHHCHCKTKDLGGGRGGEIRGGERGHWSVVIRWHWKMRRHLGRG